MGGLINQGLPVPTILTGVETINMDTQAVQGLAPQSAAPTLLQLALNIGRLINATDITPVSGTRYYASLVISVPTLVTGVTYRVGATGGTNNILAELHNSTGALVATSALAGVLVGTANSYQNIAFTAQYLAQPGTYFIALQLNGTTARVSALNAPSLPIVTGSVAGTFGTSAAFTPATTYTAGVGPVATLY